jgi:small conductance mechanosensitive channel
MSIWSRHGPNAPIRERVLKDGSAAKAIHSAKRARRTLFLLIPLIIALLVVDGLRTQLIGANAPVRVGTAILFVCLGWPLAANITRALVPRATRHMSRQSAEATLFLVRLAMLVAVVVASLEIAGVAPAAVVAGASITAIVLGLAAQQTFGNLFAGIVLLAARPFEIGDRVRFNGFGMDVEGTVAGRGLLYVTMHEGDDLVHVPNNTALTMSVRPLREPAGVDLKARIPADVDPQTVQRRVTETVTVTTRGEPDVHLEEVAGNDVVVRIRARPEDRDDGGRLAREVLQAVSEFSAETGDADSAEERRAA